jgi:hypothetical protein
MVLDVPDRATQAILSAEAWFGHGAFAETVCEWNGVHVAVSLLVSTTML